MIEVTGGNPSAEQAAAILAAVQVLVESERVTAVPAPWPYRSAWRREAIEEGAGRPYASSITALGRPPRRPSSGANDLGGSDVP